MRISLAILIALAIVYFCDAEYDEGKVFDDVQSEPVYVSQYGTLDIRRAFEPPYGRH